MGNIHAGNIYTPAAILYTGAFPAKALRIFWMLKCATIMSKTYFWHQSNILQPTIQLTRERHQLSVSENESTAKDVSGDGRADSPGHSAKYGLYSNIVID